MAVTYASRGKVAGLSQLVVTLAAVCGQAAQMAQGAWWWLTGEWFWLAANMPWESLKSNWIVLPWNKRECTWVAGFKPEHLRWNDGTPQLWVEGQWIDWVPAVDVWLWNPGTQSWAQFTDGDWLWADGAMWSSSDERWGK